MFTRQRPNQAEVVEQAPAQRRLAFPLQLVLDLDLAKLPLDLLVRFPLMFVFDSGDVMCFLAVLKVIWKDPSNG